MTIGAADLAFANRVMVGQVGLCLLLAVAGEALLVLSAAKRLRTSFALGFDAVDRVTVTALDALRLVRAREPVANVVRLGVAAQASAVGFFRRAIFEADDLVLRLFRVSASREVQASGAVTLLTLDVAQGMQAATVGLGDVGVTLRALVDADFCRSLDLDVLGEILLLFFGGLGLRLTEKRRYEEK